MIKFAFKIARAERSAEDGRVYAEGYGATTNPVRFSNRSMPRVKKLKFSRAFLEKAVPAYMARKPKVRVNHTAALGTGGQTMEYKIDDGGVWIKVRVSQAQEQAVLDGDYSEFSIGAEVTEMSAVDSDGTATATDGSVNEFSLVDQGQDDGCGYTISRAVGADEREDEPTGGNIMKKSISAQLKRVAEELTASGKRLDFTPIVERGMHSVSCILTAFEYLSSARAMELYEEATKGGAGGQSAKFMDAMMATAELAVAHLVEEFQEVFAGAPLMTENVAVAENEKRASDMAAPLMKASELMGDKAMFTETVVARFDALADGMKVLREKEKKKDDEEDGDSFEQEMAVHHANASKMHADYAKDEKDEKAKGYHEGMSAHHSAVSTTYLNYGKKGGKVDRVADGEAIKVSVDMTEVLRSKEYLDGQKVLVDRVTAAEGRAGKAETDLAIFIKAQTDLKVPELVTRVATAEKALADSKTFLARVETMLKAQPGKRVFGAEPLERGAGDKDPMTKHRIECARMQVAYQEVMATSKDAQEKRTAKDSLAVMRAGKTFDEKLSGCTTWDAAEKLMTAVAA